MAVKRCDMCFQDKAQLQPVLPGMPAMVCKACGYKINQVTGFLEYHHAVFSYQPPLSKEDPPTPLTRKPGKTLTRSMRKAQKQGETPLTPQ